MSGELLLPPCPQCHGPTTLLGQLGSVTHGRCRNCGLTYAVTMEIDEDEVRDEIEQEQAAADYSDDHDHDPNEED